MESTCAMPSVAVGRGGRRVASSGDPRPHRRSRVAPSTPSRRSDLVSECVYARMIIRRSPRGPSFVPSTEWHGPRTPDSGRMFRPEGLLSPAPTSKFFRVAPPLDSRRRAGPRRVDAGPTKTGYSSLAKTTTTDGRNAP